MKRPCTADLINAAEYLNAATGAMYENVDALDRVATWLRSYARESDDRANARRVGCTVKYYRKNMTR